MNDHKCKVGDRVMIQVFDRDRRVFCDAWRGVVLELGREVGGDREDGYRILLDGERDATWSFDYEVRKLSVLELLAEAASG